MVKALRSQVRMQISLKTDKKHTDSLGVSLWPVGLSGYLDLVPRSVLPEIFHIGFSWADVSNLQQELKFVGPRYPFESGQFDGSLGLPGYAAAAQLSFVQLIFHIEYGTICFKNSVSFHGCLI
jgi:hypothetical protein